MLGSFFFFFLLIDYCWVKREGVCFVYKSRSSTPSIKHALGFSAPSTSFHQNTLPPLPLRRLRSITYGRTSSFALRRRENHHRRRRKTNRRKKYSAPRTSGKEVQDVVIGIIVGGGGIELGDGRWDAVYGDRSVGWN